jgi:cytoskeleton protein RodZ
MTSVGETLRAERLKRKLGLDQISSELKISSKFLEAIETGQFDKLPGGVFTKSFVRQYALLLGLDAEDLAGQVQRVLEPQQPGVSQFAEKPQTAAPEFHVPKGSKFHVPKMEAWESVGDGRFRWSGSLSAAALFVVALLICSGVYTWMQRPRSVESARVPPVISAPPVVPSQVAPAPTALAPAGQNTAPASTAVAPVTPPAAQPAATPAATPSAPPAALPSATPSAPLAAPPQRFNPAANLRPPNRNATVRVEVTADEPVWMLARIDGKFAFSGTLDTHQSRTVEASGNILLRFGNAGGVTITLNGKSLGRVGPKGQVRTVQFTSGGFQIVPDKPPAVPDRL